MKTNKDGTIILKCDPSGLIILTPVNAVEVTAFGDGFPSFMPNREK